MREEVTKIGEEFDVLARKAITQWGIDAQIGMVIEECAELIDAIQKWRRHRVESAKVLEEAVDVEIMIGQLKVMFDASGSYEHIRKEKLKRLQKLLSNSDDN